MGQPARYPFEHPTRMRQPESSEKNGGCNHITCHCNTHWCWTCNTAHPRATIYDHMSLCGGIFPRDLAPEDVDYEYNEEDDD